MPNQAAVQETLIALKQLAPKGYALGMHIHFTAPTFLFQTYDQAWIDHYSRAGLVISDPTVHWAFENRGAVAWHDLVDNDPQNVIEQAVNHGLKYGVTCSVGPESRPSIGGFARDDAPFTPDEIAQLIKTLEDLHHLTKDMGGLSFATETALIAQSIHCSQPN